MHLQISIYCFCSGCSFLDLGFSFLHLQFTKQSLLNFISQQHIFITMLFFLLSCLSFLLLSHSFPTSKMKTFPWFFREFLLLLIHKRKIFIPLFPASENNFPQIRTILTPRTEEKQGISLLDLPDLPLDIILEKLSPVELCNMAGVCSWMREKCSSNHIWEKLMREKWGAVLGDAAYTEWQSQFASTTSPKFLHTKFGLFSGLLGVFGFKSGSRKKVTSGAPINSVKSCYLALESGKFWFPAQVFNREVIFLLFMLHFFKDFIFS